MSRPGHEILDLLEQAFRRWTIQQTDQDYEALALWCMATHAARHFDYAPRLVLTSAEKRSGKSRTLEIAAALAYKPMMTASVSAAALYRSVPDDGGTITVFVDEADTVFGRNAGSETAEALRGFINAGFRRGNPTIRCEGPSNVVKEYHTFSPVALAAIGRLPDTVTDRSVNIRLRRRKPSETVDAYRLRTDEPQLKDLAAAATEWAEEHADEISEHIPTGMPVDDRAADLWEPLVTVADIAGGSWPDRARDAARHHTGAEADDEDESDGIELLRDIREVLQLHQGARIGSTNLTGLLKGKEESRWAEEDLKPRRVAQLLKEFGVRPDRMPGGTGNGYIVARIEDAIERWLAVPVAPSPATPAENVHNLHNPVLTSANARARSDQRASSNMHGAREVHTHSRRSEQESAPCAPSARGKGTPDLGPALPGFEEGAA